MKTTYKNKCLICGRIICYHKNFPNCGCIVEHNKKYHRAKQIENPIPCSDCDFGTNNKSMFWIGNIGSIAIYQCEKCKKIGLLEIEEVK
jgi:hypothetical protein